MNRISEITKRDILELFRNGIEITSFLGTEKITYNYFGRLQEIEFLKRLYDLENMPSMDPRFSNAEGEIWHHTVLNDDYPPCWVFEDERFSLKNGNDETYLKFLCEIFHPAVREEKGYWKEFLEEVNRLLRADGYELYPAEKISSRDVYKWRVFDPLENTLFVPFSQRNQELRKEKKIVLSISRKTRNQIYQLLKKYNQCFRVTNETGWNYDVTTEEQVLNDIRQFYTPKCYDRNGEYVETNNLQDFVLYGSPYCLMDAIEFFGRYNIETDFEDKINVIFRLNRLPVKLVNGKIENLYENQIVKGLLNQVGEVGLQELLRDAARYYDEGDIAIAVEKIWDAFERLKTYYSPTLDKKESVEKIISDMSSNKEAFRELFEKEFRELTAIGNNFRIRHHETTKTDIEDPRHYEYFYKRCLSLISVAIQYLDNQYNKIVP